MRAVILVLPIVWGCGNVPAAPDAQIELQCFDGLDNDGDGVADCADSDCEPAARCVPDSTDEAAGVFVASDVSCPAGFTGGEVVVHRDLQAGACEGCDCAVGPTTCAADVWIYLTQAECDADTALTGGQMVKFQITPTCSPMNLLDGFIYGARADIIPTGSCTPSGAGTPGASTWGEDVKFCKSSHVASGCAAGSACAPIAVRPEDQCALSTSDSCSTSWGMAEAWYTGYDDQRTCAACQCDPVGANCDNVLVQLGRDYSCINESQVADDSKACHQNYSPPALLVGVPTQAASCDAHADAVGEINPTGQTTLCCAPN